MTKIIAHRGASGLVPFGNTYEAFDAAVAVGCSWVEIDIRRLGDGELVVFHDAAIGGHPLSSINISQARDVAQQLGFHLPRLGSTLERYRGRLKFDLEFKDPDCESEVITLASATLGEEAFVCTSFDEQIVHNLQQIAPSVPGGLLLSTQRDHPGVPDIFPMRRARQSSCTFVAPYHSLVEAGIMRRMKRLGYPVWVWTVNEPKRMARMLKLGVDAIITDRPDLALALQERLAVS